MELWIGAIAFSAIFLSVVGTSVLFGFLKHPVDDRLARYGRRQPASGETAFIDAGRSNLISSIGERIAPKDPLQRSESKQQLAMAGYYSRCAYNAYWTMKIVSILAMPLLVILIFAIQGIPLSRSTLPALFAIGGGLFLPDWILGFFKRRRQEQIFCGLPDALDLLVVCIEAGLGLDAALQKVSEEFHINNRVLSEELNMTCAVIRMGQPRADALHDLGERTGVIELRALAAVLTQADRFGTSMGQALRVHSDDMRTRRRQRAEELAAKTTVKLLFPLVLFIFPSIFVVLGGPAVIRIIDTLMGKVI
ncbi:MAG: type II secretion system F family protein [Candidatus Omnitrophota bacterium]